MADNRAALAALAGLAAARRDAPPPSPPRVAPRFEHVGSRLAAAGLGRTASALSSAGGGATPLGTRRGGNAQPPAGVKDFLRRKGASSRPLPARRTSSCAHRRRCRCCCCAPPLTRAAPAEAPPAAALPAPFVRPEPPSGARKPAVPSRAAAPPSPDAPPRGPPRDFVRANVATLAAAAPRRRPSVDPAAPAPKPADYGAVPAYLAARKADWAADADARARAAEEAARCPPGHRLLGDGEREETLALLRASLAEAADAVARQPLRVESISAVRRAAELEAKLDKLEKAVALFSKPRVYVRLDGGGGGEGAE